MNAGSEAAFNELAMEVLRCVDELADRDARIGDLETEAAMMTVTFATLRAELATARAGRDAALRALAQMNRAFAG